MACQKRAHMAYAGYKDLDQLAYSHSMIKDFIVRLQLVEMAPIKQCGFSRRLYV